MKKQKFSSCVSFHRALMVSLLALSASSTAWGQASVDLAPFYVSYEKPPGSTIPMYEPQYHDGYPAEWGSFRPKPRSLGPEGATERYAPAALSTRNYVYVESVPLTSGTGVPLSVLRRALLSAQGGPCLNGRYLLPAKLRAGTAVEYPQATVSGIPRDPLYTCLETGDRYPNNSATWPVTDRFTFGAPVRRTTISGHEYEASPMVMQRNGAPWMTYYFGYRIGMAGGESNWDAANGDRFAAGFPKFPRSAENFELTELPPPIVEGEVVEFVNAKVSPTSNGGHYFYASSIEDKVALDGSDDWVRTGRQFKSGGYVPVCRFLYRAPGSSNGTHFFTAKADECAQFKTMPGFTYEGTPFRASLPAAPVANVAADDPTRCPPKTVPLYRFFNNPAAGSYLPNHRYLTNRAAGQVTGYAGPGKPAQTWADEGIALCVAG